MTKEIILVGEKAAGRSTLVDDEDYGLLEGYKWRIQEIYGRQGTPYVKTNIYRNSYWTTVSMHGMIFDIWSIEHPQGIDHIDHDGLNNQKSNLRAVTVQQNGANRLPQRGGTSPYKGVSWNIRKGKWVARIDKSNHHYFLGYYGNEAEAACAYNKKAVELFGEYACLNELNPAYIDKPEDKDK